MTSYLTRWQGFRWTKWDMSVLADCYLQTKSWVPIEEPSFLPWTNAFGAMSVLCLAYPKYLGTAFRADALGCRPLVLHGNLFGVFDLYFFPTFHAVCLRHGTSFYIFAKHSASSLLMSRVSCFCFTDYRQNIGLCNAEQDFLSNGEDSPENHVRSSIY